MRLIPSTSRTPRRARGFTLVELMVVVVIAGIISAVAYPAYTKQVLRGKRADAQTVMMQAAQFMQRWYSAKNTYELDENKLPDDLKKAPQQSPEGKENYKIELTEADRNTYELTATPQFSDSLCGNLILNDKGQKKVSGTGTVAECWR